tara:strand:- start:282 stop:524 length:243 start_codon:yes stop_codon:yes gene_type:complete
MADMTYEDIERIWHSLALYLPDKNKSDAAVEFINTLRDIGVEESEIKASSDCDPKIEEAVGSVFADDEEEEQYDDRYEDN